MVNPKFITHSDPEVDETDVLPRTKRSLPTSVSTPEKSPGQKKISKTSQNPAKTTRKISARKSLGCHFDSNANENVDALLNIDDIISLEPEQSTRVKVLVLWPSGKTDVRVPDRKENINLLKNIALKTWTAVANAILTHSELRQDILRALWRTLNSEVKNYCSSDFVLKHRTPKELIAFSNCSLVKEVSTECPFWSLRISGACGVNIKENSTEAQIMPSLLPALLQHGFETSLCLLWRTGFQAFCFTVACHIKISLALTDWVSVCHQR